MIPPATTRIHNPASGFGAIAMILGFVGVLAFGAMIMAMQARSDLQTSQIQSQVGNASSQAEYIRGQIRVCQGLIRRANVTNAPIPWFDSYPGCQNTPISTDIPSRCVIDGTPSLEAGLANIFCQANSRYVFDGQTNNMLPSPIPNFTPWLYKKDATGVYIQTTSTDSTNFAEVLTQIRANFDANELTTTTLAADNTNTIGVFIYRAP
jgi:hypothetical protein